jgi:uncharacterized protein YgfB (UPF0149 family)
MADLTALALNAAETLSVAELHGVVCGLAIWQGEDFQFQELVDLVGTDALTDESSVEVFVSASVNELLAEDLSFSPLLPEDDADFDLRLEALAEWCAGFLAGFGAAGTARGLGSLEELPDEVQEIVSDLSAITEIDVESYAESSGAQTLNTKTEESGAEADLMQIQEFVKVGVLLILGMLVRPPDELYQ